MPVIYLSPSLQPFNEYVTGSNEQAVMNELADKMVPYLRACGIRYTRSNPDMTLGQVIGNPTPDTMTCILPYIPMPQR